LNVSAQVERSTTTRTRLNGFPLLTGRVLWAAHFAVCVVVFFGALSAYRTSLETITPDDRLFSFRLAASEVGALEALGLSAAFYADVFYTAKIIFSIVLIVVAAFIIWARSDDGMAIFSSAMLINYGLVSGQPAFFSTISLIDRNLSLYLPVVFLIGVGWAMLLTLYYVFPDGRFIPRWTVIIAIVWAAWAQVATFAPTSPLSLFVMPPLLFLLIEIGVFGTGIWSQFYRYRQTDSAVQRQQTKWVVYGFTASFLLTILFPALVGAFVPGFTEAGLPRALFNLAYTVVNAVAGLFIPLTIAFSILRFQLWNIDLVINRSLVYGTVTLLLAGVFIVILVALQQLFVVATDDQQSTAAIIIAAMAIASLFNPARVRLQRLIDRRFFRLRFDLDSLQSQPSISQPRPGTLTGMVLNGYELREPLRKGGMSEVYKGFQASLNRTVAIKVLAATFHEDREFLTRFEREARLVANLNHPHIVSVFDYGEADGVYYMVMEYVEGLNLGATLRAEGAISLSEVRTITRQVARALDYAHGRGLVHRDIKPSNIMLQPMAAPGLDEMSRRAILMDFGIAKILGGSTSITKTGLMGTLDYIAPEQIMSARAVDHHADIYSLGVVVYQMLTGELPFKADVPAQVLFAHLQRPAPDPREIVPALPDYTARAVLRALAKDPEERFPSAGAFAEALG
jgi:hypothetical protein